MSNTENILDIRGLKVAFSTGGGQVQAVRGVDIGLKANMTLGIVGESGCGKSVTSLAIMRLIPDPGKITDGEIIFGGEDLLKMTNQQMRKIRGNRISMIFQDPMTSLNPVFTIGNQMREIILEHNKDMTKKQADELAVTLLDKVGIPDPESRLSQYAHEFSGGMRQRAMIAMALANNPALLIADEPTTALDVTIQAQILDLMKSLRSEFKTSIILITHDLGVVAGTCDETKVMYAGLIVEDALTRDIFKNPGHPYTWGLLKSVPKVTGEQRERLIPINGQPPDLFKPPAGCAFAARCDYAMAICAEKQPPHFPVKGENHTAACWLHHAQAANRLREIENGGRI